MKSIEFVLERTIPAPIDQVFSRLVDIDGYGEWMPRKGTILKRTRQTSPGEAAVGTTFIDETTFGPTPGEIVELSAPTRVLFHWWDNSKSGKPKSEGWPGYSLQPTAANQTLVRHHAKLNLYGVNRLAAPIFRRLAVRERTITLESLKASFAPIPSPG